MAREAVTVDQPSTAGTVLTDPNVGVAADDFTIPNSGNTLVLVHNVSVDTAHTVGVNITKTVDGQAVAEKTKSVPFGKYALFGPFPRDTYSANLQFNIDHADLVVQAFEGR